MSAIPFTILDSSHTFPSMYEPTRSHRRAGPPSPAAEIQILSSIAELSATREAWLCDVWGVLHNGVATFPAALEACRAFKREGGAVVLISNSPRPAAGVAEQLQSLGAGRENYDAIVTSGDVTRSAVAAHADRPIFHLGPERDRAFFSDLKVRFAPANEAEVLVCTGLIDDETETVEDYEGLLSDFAARNAPMICGNPDIWVERGHRLVPCAGALAARYAELGQTVVQAGKPYRPIYDAAFAALEGRAAKDSILAIGDGVDTDIRGAAANGIDAVYIASRVHLQKQATAGPGLTPAALRDLFNGHSFRPLAALPQLIW